MVVLHHSGFAVIFDAKGGTGAEAWLRRGVAGALWRMNLGVALFFVISGYCIAASVDAIVLKPFNIAGVLRQVGRALTEHAGGQRAVVVN